MSESAGCAGIQGESAESQTPFEFNGAAGFLLLVLLNREISAVPLVVTMGLGSN